MRTIYASPTGGCRWVDGAPRDTRTLGQALVESGPGTVVRICPGRYVVREPLRISGEYSADAPLVIRGRAGVVIDGDGKPDSSYSIRDPGPDAFAAFKIESSSHVRIEDLEIVSSWPVAIRIDDCTRITIRGLSIVGATHAIYAYGAKTRGLLVERCRWLQEPAIWDRIHWAAIHDREGMDVDGQAPYRYYNGGFFGSRDIAGDVTIRDNTIEHAYNGIRLDASRRKRHLPFNRDVRIYRNRFRYIRDNPVEMEKYALNWWIHHNEFFNCHAWISLDGVYGGLWYVFSNIGWFDAKPGSEGDDNVGGTVLKMGNKKDGIAPDQPWYVFNNSWFVHSSYTKKAWTRYLRNWNNVIEYCSRGAHPRGIRADKPFFGDQVELSVEDDVKFAGDVCNNSAFDTAMSRMGLRGAGSQLAGPLFEAGWLGDLRPRPCLRGAGTAFEVHMPRGNPGRRPA